MTRPRPAGLSLLELLLAVLLVFLASLYLLSLFSSGAALALRTRDYTVATLLARNRLELLSASPMEAVIEGCGGFPDPHDGYRWDVRVEDYEGDLKMLELVVTSPRGVRSALRTLRRQVDFFGVACDPAAQRVVFAAPGQAAVQILEEEGEVSRGPALPARALPSRAGGVAGCPGLGFLWVVDQANLNVEYFRETQAGLFDAGESRAPAPGPSVASPRFAGAATDASANRLFLADRANRGVWILRDTGAFGQEPWGNGLPLSPQEPSLGVPSGVAVDASGSVLWVADTENMCLRKLLMHGLSAPSQDFEEEPGVGWWSRRRYRPDAGLATPQGLAVNPWSSAVLCVTESDLWVLDFVPGPSGIFQESWKRTPLPEDLVRARPSGICLDPFRSVVYLNTRSGQLWKHTLSPPGSFNRLHDGRSS